MTLGRRIKERRQTLGFTQLELSKITGITLQHIYAIEKDKRFASLPVLIKLSENLKASLDYLVFGKEAKIDMISAIKVDKDFDDKEKTSLINLIETLREGKKSMLSLLDSRKQRKH